MLLFTENPRRVLLENRASDKRASRKPRGHKKSQGSSKAPALPIEVLPSHTRGNAISSKGGRGERRKSVAEQEPGAAQKAKGLAKEAAGTVMGDEEMKAEGRAEREGSEGPAEWEGSEGHKEYFRKIIEETNKRSSGKA